MVSPELIRRFSFFGGFDMDQIVFFAGAAEEEQAPRDHYFFHEGEDLKAFYLIMEGEVTIVTHLPQKGQEVILDSLNSGDVFAWSALVPPYASTAGAKSVTPARVIRFDAGKLRQKSQEDCDFGFQLMSRIATVIRDRLNSLRLETLAYLAS